MDSYTIQMPETFTETFAGRIHAHLERAGLTVDGVSVMAPEGQPIVLRVEADRDPTEALVGYVPPPPVAEETDLAVALIAIKGKGKGQRTAAENAVVALANLIGHGT